MSEPAFNIDDIWVDGRENWTVGDLKTIEDCAAAMATLTAAIVAVEGQLSVARALATEGQYSDRVWFAKAKAALRWKKAGLQAVQLRRGQINRAEKLQINQQRDRLLLQEIKDGLPKEQFYQFVRSIAARYPHLWPEVG